MTDFDAPALNPDHYLYRNLALLTLADIYEPQVARWTPDVW